MRSQEPTGSGHLVLRDVTESDLPTFFADQSDADALRMAAFQPRDREAFMAHWGRILRDPNVTTKTILFAGRVAGNAVSFERCGQREVGYWIGKSYWGQGIATRALAQLLDEVTARPLYARVAKHNVGSIRVLEKCGFTVSEPAVGDAEPGDGVEEVILKLESAASTPGVPATILETERLALRRLSAGDAPFIFELLNDPDWVRFIGDRGVRSVEQAGAYISNGPVEMYRRLGFGMYLVERKQDAVPIGMCGLVKRDGIDDIEIGFAFLPQFRAQGYALESASAAIDYAHQAFGLDRLAAIVSPENHRSAKLLEKLGMRFEKMVQLANDSQPVQVFGIGDRT